MSTFNIHDLETTPEDSKELLKDSKESYGMIPNLHGILAEAPGTLKAYKTQHQLFESSSFDKEEITVVWQTINVEHECHYCVPAHTAVANMMEVDPAITEALRKRTEMPTDKLQVLHETTLLITRNRGNITEDKLDDFYDAGYTKRQVLEIILALSQKVISNYTNHIAETPVDEPFKKFSWEKSETKETVTT